MWPEALKEMFSVTSHQGNPNPNHKDATSVLPQWLKLSRQTMTSIGGLVSNWNPVC